MGIIQSATQAVTQAVSDVASDVKDSVKAAASDTAKQIAKTPLDILEELLGSSGKTDGQSPSSEEKGDTGQMAAAALKQKSEQDETYRAQRHEELHKQIYDRSQAFYEQKKVLDEQSRQQQMQQEEQKRFQINQLEKKKSNDYALNAAKDASSAEKRVGAG